MLVLSRKAGQRIVIGENIEVIVLECRDGIVKLGIEAPKEIKVFRKEILDEIKNENSQAVEIDSEIVKNLLKEKLI